VLVVEMKREPDVVTVLLAQEVSKWKT